MAALPLLLSRAYAFSPAAISGPVCHTHAATQRFNSPIATIAPASTHGSVTARQRSSRLFCSAAESSAATEPATPSSPQIRQKVKNLLESGSSLIGETVLLKGWVRTVRQQKTFAFIELNDGSSLQGMQVVAPEDIDTYAVVDDFTTGAAVSIEGVVVESPAQKQDVEIKATKMELVGGCPADVYPLQKKRHSLEFLRSIAHLRPRTNTIGAISRIRSSLAYATHSFFQENGFQYVQTPLITASDCEGAGEMFRVTTLPTDTKKDAKDFFGKPAFLTVSGQLSAETYACALGDVYTFGPTFRAEDSNTARHLAEFWMIEPEMAFADLQDDMDNAEAYVKHVVAHVMQHCSKDIEFFGKFQDKGLAARLDAVVQKPFARVEYRKAVEMLQKEIAKNPKKWEYPEVEFGTDLATEHERWLAEVAFGTATFVYNYPKSIKAFYMRDNDDGETVAAMDLLVPGVGELVGGSQREERLEKLQQKMADAGLSEEEYWWYLDLRRYGSVPHSGYGLGFERLVCYVTGTANIRDAIAFPRFPGSCEF